MSGLVTERLLPPKEARRCLCGEPNTTGLCAYPVGKCPRESKPESGTPSEQGSSLMDDREWRPLRNEEYPPPGPTKLAEPVERNGQMVRPILVLTPRRYCVCGRNLHGYRGPRCRYCDGTAE